MNGIVLSLLGAVLLGGYTFLVKRYFDHYPVPVYVLGAYVAALAWYLPIAAVTTAGVPVPTDPTALVVAVAVSVGVLLALLAFFAALTAGEVSYVAPISKVVPVFVLPVEVLVLHERLSAMQVVGVVVATAGLYLVNYERGELLTPLKRTVTARPAQLALASAATFALVDVGKRFLMSDLQVDPAAFVVVMLTTVAVGVAPLALRKVDAGKMAADWWKFGAMGAVVAVGQHVVAMAFELVPASVASPLVNAQAVVAVVLGGMLLNEPKFGMRLVAAAIAIAGVALVTLG